MISEVRFRSDLGVQENLEKCAVGPARGARLRSMPPNGVVWAPLPAGIASSAALRHPGFQSQSTSLIQWLAPRVDHGVVPASASSGRASFKVSLLDHTRFPRDCASACTLSRNSSAVLHADDNAERLCESDPLGCTASAANCPARSEWVVVHCNGKRAEQQRLDLWHPADHRNNNSGLSAWLRGRTW